MAQCNACLLTVVVNYINKSRYRLMRDILYMPIKCDLCEFKYNITVHWFLFWIIINKSSWILEKKENPFEKAIYKLPKLEVSYHCGP